ncbi:MAG: DNA polymerase beta superfamily protein [Saprospiraceae bacterium]
MIREQIHDLLQRIEKEHNVQILFAAESGSRAWGFASPDSDYDVRILFLHPRERYLSVFEPTDNIRLMEADGLLDVSGWDLRKALRLCHGSNSSVFEWLQSPIIYREVPDFKADMWATILPYFSARRIIRHFLGIAKGTLERDFDNGNATDVKIKKYFYILRPVLASMWAAAFRTPPPTVFHNMLSLLDAYPDVKEAVLALLQRKETAAEGEQVKRIPVIDHFVKEQMEKCHQIAETIEKPVISSDGLDHFYKKLLKII